MKYKSVELRSICSRLSSGKNIPANQVFSDKEIPVYGGNGIRGYTNKENFGGECAIIGRQGAYCGNVRYFKGKAYMTEHAVVVCANDENNTRYLAYYLSLMKLGRLSGQSAQPGLSVKTLGQQEVMMPLKSVQDKVVGILSLFDDKIAKNVAINENLEQQAQAIFNETFIDRDTIPDNWSEASLLDIAEYLNGLAMQKYRPSGEEKGIPVLKIKELRQGSCDASSELCSSNIKSDYIINDGDVIFSWSGSLLVDFWCGGTCGLNQHLFKVSSYKYDKWFYYAWTKHHLNKFIALASAMATTMGHIKRTELANSKVLIPNKEEYIRIGSIINPIYDLVIANRVENMHLAKLRDTLLPKLMSGELDVSAVII